MLAKLTFLQKEEAALRDIESKISEQLTRLQQEELHLRSLLRESEDGESFLEPARLRSPTQQVHELQNGGDTSVAGAVATTGTDNIVASHTPSIINTTPLEDLTLQPSAIPVRPQMEEVEEEEEEEEEAEDGNDESERHCDDMGYNVDLMQLMQQIQGRTEPE